MEFPGAFGVPRIIWLGENDFHGGLYFIDYHYYSKMGPAIHLTLNGIFDMEKD